MKNPACSGTALHVLLTGVAFPLVASLAMAQGSPVRMELQGPGSRVSRGALRCAIGDDTQFSLNGLDSADQRVVLEQYLPEVTSSDEHVVVVSLAESSPYVVNATCKADGEAWIIVQAGDAKLEFPALVGKARSRPTPRARGDGATASTPATSPATSPAVSGSGAQVVAPAIATRPNAMPGQQINTPPASETRASVVSNPAVANAPAVAATGLVLYAGYNNVQLTWRPAPGAAGYRVARKDVAANTLVTLTGDNVTSDGRGLVRDTSFFDGSAVADRQYVYYLATYFQRPNGEFYFPDRNSEARGVATPRNSKGLPWLPADWKARPQPKAASVIAGPALKVSWHSKSRAAGYIFFTYLSTRENPGTSCDGRGFIMPALSAPLPGQNQVTMDSSLVKGMPGMVAVDPPLPGETRRGGLKSLVDEQLPVTLYCIAVHAVYPDELDGSGTPVVTRFNQTVGSGWGSNADEGVASKPLWIVARRSCPSGITETSCTPWAVLPTNDIPQNAP